MTDTSSIGPPPIGVRQEIGGAGRAVLQAGDDHAIRMTMGSQILCQEQRSEWIDLGRYQGQADLRKRDCVCAQSGGGIQHGPAVASPVPKFAYASRPPPRHFQGSRLFQPLGRQQDARRARKLATSPCPQTVLLRESPRNLRRKRVVELLANRQGIRPGNEAIQEGEVLGFEEFLQGLGRSPIRIPRRILPM